MTGIAPGSPVRPDLEKLRSRRRARLRIGLGVAILTLVLAAGAVAGTGFTYSPLPRVSGAGAPQAPSRPKGEEARLARALGRLAPRGLYIVIDSGTNKLYVRKGTEVVMEADCSTGTGLYLKVVDGGKSWTFDTPRGQFAILYKSKYPVWKKPDWAFLEEGKPPPTRESDRFEEGVLGEYGLYFGDGYLIHGTLYERLLGQSVSHGCIRLGRDPLRQLYKMCPEGTPIFIF